MALVVAQQIRTALEASRHVLVTFPKAYTLDSLGSALALALAAQGLGTRVTVAADGFTWPSQYPFLPAYDVQPTLAGLQQFQLKVKLDRTPLAQLSYSATPEELTVVLVPKQGAWTAADVRTETSDYQYDLIAMVGAADRDSLGAIYADHRDFFFRTPTIAIDHHAANDGFGQYRLVDVTAAATAELVHRLLEEWRVGLGKPIATCLLAGIIEATRSFRDPRTTPATLQAASALVAADADRAGIIRALYRSTPLATLQLWGRVLARLKSDDARRLVWAAVSESDFAESATTPADLPGVLDDLVVNLPTAEAAALLYVTPRRGVRAVVRSYRHRDARALVAPLPATGTAERVELTFSADTALADAEAELIRTLREALNRED